MQKHFSQETALQIIPIRGIKTLDPSDSGKKLVEILKPQIESHAIPSLKPGDIIAFSHTFLAKIYGHITDIAHLSPSQVAQNIAQIGHKEPKHVQLILNQSKNIIRTGHVLITENKAGIIGTNAGVDKSNIFGETSYAYIPEDPNAMAKQVQHDLEPLLQRKVPIIITDSLGRPFREGAVGIAIGSVDVPTIRDYRGTKDLYTYTLQSKETAVADQLAAAADFVMGQSTEGIPMVFIRGAEQFFDGRAKESAQYSAQRLQRPANKDLFRKIDWESAIKFRSSYKQPFSSQIVSDDLILKAIELATMAPNAHNAQCWRIINLGDKNQRRDIIQAMQALWKKDMESDGVKEPEITKKIENSQSTFMNAPVLLLFCINYGDLQNYIDPSRQVCEKTLGIQTVAAAATTFLLALEGLGLAGCWYSAPLFASEIIKTQLKLPPHWQPQLFITVGFPQEREFGIKCRKPQSKIYFPNTASLMED